MSTTGAVAAPQTVASSPRKMSPQFTVFCVCPTTWLMAVDHLRPLREGAAHAVSRCSSRPRRADRSNCRSSTTTGPERSGCRAATASPRRSSGRSWELRRRLQCRRPHRCPCHQAAGPDDDDRSACPVPPGPFASGLASAPDVRAGVRAARAAGRRRSRRTELEPAAAQGAGNQTGAKEAQNHRPRRIDRPPPVGEFGSSVSPRPRCQQVN